MGHCTLLQVDDIFSYSSRYTLLSMSYDSSLMAFDNQSLWSGYFLLFGRHCIIVVLVVVWIRVVIF